MITADTESDTRSGGTAAQVAALAKVSVFTVSRAFSGSDVVSSKTREKIFEAARRVGYTPNAYARALRTGKVPTVALVQPARVMNGEFYCDILAGLQHAVEAKGLDVLLCSVPVNTSPLDCIQNLASTGRCGAIAILMNVHERAMLQAIKKTGLPLVLLNSTPEDQELQEVASVGFDNRTGVQHALRHLYEIGHRNIAYFGCPSLWADTLRREEGFRLGMKEAGLVVQEEWVVNCVMGPQSGGEAFDAVYSRLGPKPTAILCATDDIALGVLGAARRWGKSIPSDISIVGHDDNAWTGFYSPALTTVRHKGWDLGEQAGQVIIRQYDDISVPVEHIVLTTQLLVRQSTSRPAESRH